MVRFYESCSEAVVEYRAAPPRHVHDTCDAIFGSGLGCQWHRLLNCEVTTFICEWLLLAPVVSREHPMRDRNEPEIADPITKSANTAKDDWCSFWTSAEQAERMTLVGRCGCPSATMLTAVVGLAGD